MPAIICVSRCAHRRGRRRVGSVAQRCRVAGFSRHSHALLVVAVPVQEPAAVASAVLSAVGAEGADADSADGAHSSYSSGGSSSSESARRRRRRQGRGAGFSAPAPPAPPPLGGGALAYGPLAPLPTRVQGLLEGSLDLAQAPWSPSIGGQLCALAGRLFFGE